ncbi:hypothetical protein C8R44DRAFT_885356 [Mycena epipterygia]|nr:hypothetical protein C8R44DRAFT_885356 [Mycena epipterygia]
MPTIDPHAILPDAFNRPKGRPETRIRLESDLRDSKLLAQQAKDALVAERRISAEQTDTSRAAAEELWVQRQEAAEELVQAARTIQADV